MSEQNDILKNKIKNAKEKLPEQSRQAIEKVDWRNIVLSMREKKGFTFSQIEELGNQTELLLVGLIGPENYNKELESKMGLSKDKVNELVIEMNTLVFKKIREELMKINSGIKEEQKAETRTSSDIMSSAGIEINKEPVTIVQPKEEKESEKTANRAIMSSVGIEINKEPAIIAKPKEEKPIERKDLLSKVENPSLIQPVNSTPTQKNPLLTQKLSGSFQMPSKATEHSLGNISKFNSNNTVVPTPHNEKQGDPYRLSPNE